MRAGSGERGKGAAHVLPSSLSGHRRTILHNAGHLQDHPADGHQGLFLEDRPRLLLLAALVLLEIAISLCCFCDSHQRKQGQQGGA